MKKIIEKLNSEINNIIRFFLVMFAIFFTICPTTFASELSDIKLGDVVSFGRYEFNDSVVDWEWDVIDIKDDKALLFSKYIIDCLPYSEIKEYLNAICKNNFTSDEIDRIVKVYNGEPVDDYENKQKMGHILDYMFVPYEKYITQYLYDENNNIKNDVVYGLGTKYAYEKGLNAIYRDEKNDIFSSAYWLADQGYTQSFNKAVSYNGNIIDDGYYWKRFDIGVRPMIKVKIHR